MSSALPAGHRPVESRIGQLCHLCGQVDDHPRHTVYDANAVGTGVIQDHHFDCGAANGCAACAHFLDKAPNDARHGAELIAHLTKDM